jgi:hypothetical protein
VIAGLLLALVVAQAKLTLEIGPWTGADLKTATRSAARYRLTVTGPPNSAAALVASNVADGWLAAFCTPRVCSPDRVDALLSPAGRAVYQFELIRLNRGAPKRSGARIRAGDSAVLDVAPVSLQ